MGGYRSHLRMPAVTLGFREIWWFSTNPEMKNPGEPGLL
jgi:hypothetical protein